VYNLYIRMTNTLPLSDIWTASEAIDVDFHASRSPDDVIFRPEKLRESPDFAELSDIDFRLASLMTRRQNGRFGWLDKPQSMKLPKLMIHFFDVLWRSRRHGTDKRGV
jgi:hypothetical protein